MTQLQENIKNLSLRELELLKTRFTPKLSEFCPHIPTAKPPAFMLLRQKEALYGGAAGGGKSDALLMDALQNVDVKGYAAIIFRKTFADLNKPSALIPRSQEWFARAVEEKKVKWEDKNKRWLFLDWYGKHSDVRSILQFGYMDGPRDYLNYQGGEYQYIGFDEVSHFRESDYRYMFSRLRKLKQLDVSLKVRGATNPPDNEEGMWVYTRFVNKETRNEKAIFIPSGISDNPYLDEEEYREALAELDPVTRARLEDGNWTITRKGNMYRRSWFPVVDETGAEKVTVRFWDIAATKNKKSDETVGFKLSREGNVYTIEDIEIRKGTPDEIETLMKSSAASDGYFCYIREERQPGAAGLFVENSHMQIFEGYNYGTIPSNQNKVERAKPSSASAERGEIRILSTCRNINRFFDQAEAFPGGTHDDIVDAFAGSYNFLKGFDYSGIPIAVNEVDSNYYESIDGGSYD